MWLKPNARMGVVQNHSMHSQISMWFKCSKATHGTERGARLGKPVKEVQGFPSDSEHLPEGGAVRPHVTVLGEDEVLQTFWGIPAEEMREMREGGGEKKGEKKGNGVGNVNLQ